MTNQEFKDWLDERIKVLGTELEECIMAKRALNKAQSIIDGKARQAQHTKPKPGHSRHPKGDKSKRVLAMFMELGPMHGIKAVGIQQRFPDLTVKEIGNVLSRLKIKGEIVKDDQNHWFLKEPSAVMEVAVNG